MRHTKLSKLFKLDDLKNNSNQAFVNYRIFRPSKHILYSKYIVINYSIYSIIISILNKYTSNTDLYSDIFYSD